MKLKDIVAEARSIADDMKQPFLWTTERLLSAANRAVHMAARGALLLRDTGSDDVCLYDISTDGEPILLDKRVVRVERAKIVGETAVLDLKTVADLDMECPGWESLSAGMPRVVVTDYTPGYLLLSPKSDVARQMRLTVYRTPLKSVLGLEDEPEFPDRGGNHFKLVYWVLSEMYRVNDSELENEALAEKYESTFYDAFGISTPRGERVRENIFGRDLTPNALA